MTALLFWDPIRESVDMQIAQAGWSWVLPPGQAALLALLGAMPAALFEVLRRWSKRREHLVALSVIFGLMEVAAWAWTGYVILLFVTHWPGFHLATG